MIISLIVAADENGVIGKEGGLPWDLPDDLKHFRDITKGHPIIMGRKTYESIGRPLPGRQNIVITRQSGLVIEGCEVVQSLQGAFDIADESDEVFVIGGGEIYRHSIKDAGKIYLTRVHTTVEGGDAFFPEVSDEEWKEVSREEHSADDTHAFAYTFLELERIS